MKFLLQIWIYIKLAKLGINYLTIFWYSNLIVFFFYYILKF